MLDPRLTEFGIKEESRSVSPFINPSSLYHPYATLSSTRTWAQHSTNTSRTYSDETSEETEGEDDVDHSMPNECNKLKGVYWPGMDIFDSATPDMRRKRNQKKDISVVEQLEASSREVEASELIFTPDHFSFKKKRDISGLPEDDSSPTRSDTPPLSRGYSKRPALSELDRNRSSRSSYQPSYPSGYHSSYQPSTRISTPSFPTHGLYHDTQMEQQLMYGGAKRKRGFEIFQDDSEVNFGQPSGFNYLTAEYSYQPSTLFDSKPVLGNSFHMYEKENLHPNIGFNQSHCSNSTDTTSTFLLSQPASGYFQTDQSQVMPGFFTQQSTTYTPFKLDDHMPQEDMDEERTITAPPSDAAS